MRRVRRDQMLRSEREFFVSDRLKSHREGEPREREREREATKINRTKHEQTTRLVTVR
jgi:hypothetical protein